MTGTAGLHSVVIAFMGLLIAILTSALLWLLVSGISSQRWDTAVLVVPAILAFLIAMMRFGFAVESRRALDELALIVGGDVDEG